MVLKRLAAAAFALALVAGSAHAQTKTPAQLTAQTSIASGDLFLIWPAATNGPLHQVQYGVLQSQLQSALGSTYLQVNNNLSDLNSPSLARGNLGLGALATEANPTSAQITTGLGYTPVHPTYTGETGAHVIGLGWNGNHGVLDVDNGNFAGTLALSSDLSAYAPLSGATFGGLVAFSGSPIQVGSGATSGLYGDANNVAIRALNVSGSTIYFQPYSGTSTWGAIGASGFSLNVPIIAPSFSGPLTGTASNASQLSTESLSTSATASTVAGRDGAGNLTAVGFYGAFYGTATNASALSNESLATSATASTVAGRDGSGNLYANDFVGGVVDGTTTSSGNFGVRIRATSSGGAGILQFTDNGAQNQWSTITSTSGVLNLNAANTYASAINATTGAFSGAVTAPNFTGLASNSSALQGYTPTNSITANSIPVRDGNSNINANSVTLGSTGAQVGAGVAAGYYADSNNIAIRGLNNSSSTIFLQSYNGSSTWGTVSSSGFTSYVPFNASSITGALNGNASTASACNSGCTIGGSGNAAAFVNASGSGAGSISYGTAAPGTLAVGAIYLQTN